MEKKICKIAEEEDDGIRLQSFLRGRLGLTEKEISRAKFREDGICVQGERKKVNAILHTGDCVEVLLETSKDTSGQLVDSAGELCVLYEDADIIVADKPAGLVVHPAGGHYADTLANRLAAHLRSEGEDSVIRILGRLDKDTSGVVLAVKNRSAALRLERQRECRSFRKIYLALVQGVPDPPDGWIQKPIGNDPLHRGKMKVDVQGKPARTHYETIFRAESGEKSLIRLTLQTGRTHQIRLHMASIGHPLLGDPLYGVPDPEFDRTALHAASLDFLQPFTGDRIHVEAGLPKDFDSSLSAMGFL